MEDPPADTNVHLPFSEPIFVIEVPGARADRDAAAAWLLAHAANDPGTKRSNRGGWRSTSDLDRSGNDETRALIGRVVRLCDLFLRGAGMLSAEQRLDVQACWATINSAGDWNVPHSHYGQDWSAVFHLDIPPTMSDQEGQLLFIDPLGPRHGRPTVNMVTPVAGRALLFPAGLVHMVAPHAAEQPRISLAFNLDVVDVAPEDPK